MVGVSLIIFGAAGDLAKRKLIPALYALFKQKKLSSCVMVGCAITNTTAQEILNEAKSFVGEVDDALWHAFSSLFYYQAGIHFTREADIAAFHRYVCEIEQQHGLGNKRLIYCAFSSDYFCELTHLIGKTKLAQRSCKVPLGWHRIVYEKPFGKDLASAREINECIAHYFDEEQIYRIDHYLTKELAGNIALLRFTNCIFEPLWDNRYIDNVQIIVDESYTVSGRGLYYDKYGALRDMVQNHIMELIALIAMEPPTKLEAEQIRSERAYALQFIHYVDGILGQYQGYRDEPGVDPDSTTETWASLMVALENPRWSGVPFYVRTGKAMQKKETVIHIVFKSVECLLVHGCPVPANYLTIRIDPDAGFTLYLNAKKPGSMQDIIPVAMDFCHSCLYAQATPRPYEILLEEVLRGTQTVVVRFDEIEQAWRIIDEIRAKNLPVYQYAQGSCGPKEFQEFSQRHGIGWRS